MIDPILQFTTAMQGFSMTRDLAYLRREADRLRMATLNIEDENAASSFYKSNFVRYQSKYAGQQKRLEEYRKAYAELQERELKMQQQALERSGKPYGGSVLIPTSSTIRSVYDEKTKKYSFVPITIDEFLSVNANDERNRVASDLYKNSTGSGTSPYDLAKAYQTSLERIKDYKPTYERYKRMYDEERSKLMSENELKLAEFNKARGEILAQAAKLYGYKGPTITERPL